MATRYDEAPQLVHDHGPEVHYPPTAPEVAHHYQQYPQPPATPMKTASETRSPHLAYTPIAGSSAPSTYAYDHQSPYGGTVPPSDAGAKKSKRIMGCVPLVFILSIIIAVLAVAVIGLAAGTGIQASRASDLQKDLNAARANGGTPTTVTVSPSATPTNPNDFSKIDKGCGSNSAGVSGSPYTSQFLNRASFKIFCDANAPNTPLVSLFVGTFDDCLDACGFYSNYIPEDFPDSAATNNGTCAGVSFIPAWTNRTTAVAGGAPGNCYLKPGPQNQTGLETPNAGVSVHAAILQS